MVAKDTLSKGLASALLIQYLASTFASSAAVLSQCTKNVRFVSVLGSY